MEIEANSKESFHLSTGQNEHNGEQFKEDEKLNHQRGSSGRENGKINGVESSVQSIITANNAQNTSCDSYTTTPT